MVVEPVPLSIAPVKTRSFAVTVRALLVVDKVPDEIVKSPAPLLSRSASRVTAPFAVKLSARVIPEFALSVAAPAEVNALLTVTLPFDESVNAPFAVMDPPEAPRVILPPEEVMPMPLTSVSPELPPCRLIFPVALNVLLARVRPFAVIVTVPAEDKALFTLVAPVEVRVRFPKELMVPPARVKALAEFRAIPLANDRVEEFALMSKPPDEVVMLLFKVMPEFAVRATAPAAVKLPVKVMLEGAVKVKAPAAAIPPVVALKEMFPALVNVTPLAMLILSFGDTPSATLLESPSRVRAPAVVVRLALTSMPLTALAVRAENEEAAPSKKIPPLAPDTCASLSSTPPVKVEVV